MAIGYGRLTPVRKAGSTVSRSAHHGGHRLSHGAGGRAAYLSADKIVNNNLAMTTDYTDKFGVEHSELVLPGGGTADRERFWNSVDAHKTQSPNATVARDMIIALPHEFSHEERKIAAKELATWIAERYHVAVDYGLHLPETHKGSSEKNYHGHFLISERTVSPAGELGKIQRELNQMVCQQIDESRGRLERKPTAAKEIRLAWESIANDTLERGGHSERIDMHTRNAIPSQHLGKERIRELRLAEQAATAEIGLRSVSQLRAELRELSETISERSRMATKRIEEIQAARREGIDRTITSRIGSVDDWADDAMGTFMRAWKSEDNAQKIRHKLQVISQEVRIMRDATEEEAKVLKSLGRMRSRSESLRSRVENVSQKLESLDPTDTIKVGDGKMNKTMVYKLERHLETHIRSQSQEQSLEMSLA